MVSRETHGISRALARDVRKRVARARLATDARTRSSRDVLVLSGDSLLGSRTLLRLAEAHRVRGCDATLLLYQRPTRKTADGGTVARVLAQRDGETVRASRVCVERERGVRSSLSLSLSLSLNFVLEGSVAEERKDPRYRKTWGKKSLSTSQVSKDVGKELSRCANIVFGVTKQARVPRRAVARGVSLFVSLERASRRASRFSTFQKSNVQKRGPSDAKPRGSKVRERARSRFPFAPLTARFLSRARRQARQTGEGAAQLGPLRKILVDF